MTSIAVEVLPNVGDWAIRILAIVGGAALGGLLCGLILQITGRVMVHKPVRRIPLNATRLLGAGAAGYGVFLVVFGTGSGGLGWGDGFGWGGSNNQGNSNAQAPSMVAPGDPSTGKQLEDILRIVMLGGMDAEKTQRFYKIQTTKQELTLDELRVHLEKMGKDKPKLIIVVLTPEGVAPGHQAIRNLEDLGKQLGIEVK